MTHPPHARPVLRSPTRSPTPWPTAARWWRWRARSSATACPTRRTSRWPSRSRASSASTARCRPRSRSSTAAPDRAVADDLELLASDPDVAKVSVRDLPYVVARGTHGATTVAATMRLAALAGIRVFVTGGLGGVHRGAQETFDVSADLTELGTTAVAVVSAGRQEHPRHRAHAGDPRDARGAGAGARQRRVPVVLLPQQRPRRRCGWTSRPRWPR